MHNIFQFLQAGFKGKIITYTPSGSTSIFQFLQAGFVKEGNGTTIPGSTFQFLQAGFSYMAIRIEQILLAFNSFKPDSNREFSEPLLRRVITFNSFKPDSNSYKKWIKSGKRTFNSFKPDSKKHKYELWMKLLNSFNSFKPDSEEFIIRLLHRCLIYFQFLQAGFSIPANSSITIYMFVLSIPSSRIQKRKRVDKKVFSLLLSFNSFKPDSRNSFCI